MLKELQGSGNGRMRGGPRKRLTLKIYRSYYGRVGRGWVPFERKPTTFIG